MKILLTNDDGYNAQGIEVLIALLSQHNDVAVTAPMNPQSGASTGVTPDQYFEFKTYQNDKYPKVIGFIFDAKPVDCVHLGLEMLQKQFNFKPEIIISGINKGANLGWDIHNSGTFGAAREGFQDGYPALALSNLDFNESFDAEAKRVEQYLDPLIKIAMSNRNCIVNANFPRGNIKQVIECQYDNTTHFYILGTSYQDKDGKKLVMLKLIKQVDKYKENFDIDNCLKGYLTVSFVGCDMACVSQNIDVKQVK